MKLTCVGTGLLALDIILNGNPSTPPKFHVGGSCGNVLTILAYLGWDTYPIARLSRDTHSKKLLNELKNCRVNTKFITRSVDGSTPIIIHRITKNAKGQPIHRFEFKEPETGNWLPRFKPVLNSNVTKIESILPKAEVFYFDKISRSAIELAKLNKEKGALVFFEPSSIKNIKMFNECLEVCDIVKFSQDRISNYSELFPVQRTMLEIQTTGKDGLIYRFGKHIKSRKWKKLSGYMITDLIDSAGAGDWTSAGIILRFGKQGRRGFLRKKEASIKEGLDFAQRLGAINCFFEGARGAMNNLNQKQISDLLLSFNKMKLNNLKSFESTKKTI